MTTHTLTREEVFGRLRNSIESASFDQGICHLYAHALIDRVVGAGTISFRNQDGPVIERYFTLLAQGVDRGVAIRQIEADQHRNNPIAIKSQPVIVSTAVPAILASAPVAAPETAQSRQETQAVRPALEDEVERAVAGARDRLRIELHDACSVLAADAERLGAKQAGEIRSRVETATRAAIESIASAREKVNETLHETAWKDLQSRLEAAKTDVAHVIAGLGRAQSADIIRSIRDSGAEVSRETAELIDRRLKESEDHIRALSATEIEARSHALAETVRADLRASTEAAIAEATRAIAARGAFTLEETLVAIRKASETASEVAAREAESRVANITAELDKVSMATASELDAIAGNLTIAATQAASEIKTASEEGVRVAIETIRSSSRAVEEEIRALATSEVRARIDAMIEESLAGAREQIKGPYLAAAQDTLQNDLARAEERIAASIEKQLARFETKIHTCFELSRSINTPAPPRSRIESFHAFLSGFADLFLPLWGMVAGPGRVYVARPAPPVPSEVAKNVVAFPEKAA